MAAWTTSELKTDTRLR